MYLLAVCRLFMLFLLLLLFLHVIAVQHIPSNCLPFLATLRILSSHTHTYKHSYLPSELCAYPLNRHRQHHIFFAGKFLCSSVCIHIHTYIVKRATAAHPPLLPHYTINPSSTISQTASVCFTFSTLPSTSSLQFILAISFAAKCALNNVIFENVLSYFWPFSVPCLLLLTYIAATCYPFSISSPHTPPNICSLTTFYDIQNI